MDIQEKIRQLPDSPGVYLIKDNAGKIIYIGKAKSLRRRLNSYLGAHLSEKTNALIFKAFDLEYRLCQSESLALLLEASLIHKYRPKYNVSLRDDKSFPYVKVTGEEFPAIYITRKREQDNSRYFGPYTNVKLLREALKIIRRNFPYRSCKAMPGKACIYYRIKLSPAPCINKITSQEYRKTIEEICLLLDGATDELVRELSQEMDLRSKNLDFEGAAVLRDKIIALSSLRPPGFSSPQAALGELKEILGLENVPRRIEAFDVSNIFGLQATASLVSFYDGIADKDNYRRFRIKTVKGIDDYRMLAEAVFRRYKRLKEEKLSLPGLILIDGGRGQLSAAKKALDCLGVDIPVISLAKREELIYALSRDTPIRLKPDSAALRLIQRIRDESHRFAIKYHHILRKRELIE